MLKGILSFFKCCKPQNRMNKTNLDTINNLESEKNKCDDNKKMNKNPLDKSLTTKNTNIVTTATINNDKEKSPEEKIIKVIENNNKNIIKNNEKETLINQNNFEKDLNSNIKKNFKIEFNQKNEINNEIINEKEIILNDKDLKIEFKENQYDDGRYYTSNENLIEIIQEPEKYQENKVENKISIIGNIIIKEDFDKIIVPDSYIREDEKGYLKWVNLFI